MLHGAAKKKKVIKNHDVTGLPEIIYFIVLFSDREIQCTIAQIMVLHFI